MVPKVPFHSALAVQLGEEVLTRLEELTGEVCWTAFGFSTDGTGKCRNADRRFVLRLLAADVLVLLLDLLALRLDLPEQLPVRRAEPEPRVNHGLILVDAELAVLPSAIVHKKFLGRSSICVVLLLILSENPELIVSASEKSIGVRSSIFRRVVPRCCSGRLLAVAVLVGELGVERAEIARAELLALWLIRRLLRLALALLLRRARLSSFLLLLILFSSSNPQIIDSGLSRIVNGYYYPQQPPIIVNCPPTVVIVNPSAATAAPTTPTTTTLGPIRFPSSKK
ncbi:hypothetical protein pipiens_016815 [Culex pipiens pipiens]|uniref:Uncharacterized protein n=1 Tax=Culex pipiens pipiens TaxID=38569 RepID=A0ABD1CJM6_CULPP